MKASLVAMTLVATSLLACNARLGSSPASDEGQTESRDSTDTKHILGVPVPKTISVHLGDTDHVLTTVGAGIRSKQPIPGYIDPNDPLTDIVNGLIPYFVFELFVPDADSVVRVGAPDYSSADAFTNNPFLDSLAAQSPVVMRFATVRSVDSDLFTLAMEKKFIGNGLTDQPGHPSSHPEDTQPRADFLTAYRKIGWYDKGDYADFIVEKDADGAFKVTQTITKTTDGVTTTRILYPTEGTDRVPFVKGGPTFGREIIGIMTAYNDDHADPGMAACRNSVLSGYLGE